MNKNSNIENKFDIIIVGAGASGLMAAVSALAVNKKVLLLEKNEKAGKKIYITGKGRCNITNNKDISEFFDYIFVNKEFMYSSLYTFTNQMLIDLLNKNGLNTKVERGDRVFPISDKASDVTKTLMSIISKHKKKIEIRYNTNVTDLIVSQDDDTERVTGVITDRNEKIPGNSVILATGGKSYELTGSTGEGYKIAKKYGHKIMPLKPTLVSIKSGDKFLSELAGLTLKNVNVRLFESDNKKPAAEKFGELLFTHTGVSGPTVLYLSNFVNLEKKPYITIDLKPALDEKALDKRILKDFEELNNKDFKNSLDKLLPKSLAKEIIKLSSIDENKKVNQISKTERQEVVRLLKNFRVNVSGIGGFNEAVVTKGGISVKEINPSTMESKIIKNLYFTGELIDVHAATGGYNLQIAFSTGYLAGENA